METVYRLEHVRSKIGPYRHYVAHSWHCKKIHDKIGRLLRDRFNECPIPGLDGIEIYSHDTPNCLRFGFKSLQQLENWFGPTLLGYLFLNFRIYTYQSDDILYGRNQVAFIPKSRRVPLQRTVK